MTAECAALSTEVISTEIVPAVPAAAPAAGLSRRALAKADLLQHYTDALAACPRGQKLTARSDFVAAYNGGILYPLIYSILGPVSWKTIETWKSREGADLADRRGAWRRGACLLTDEQKDVLICCALKDSAPRISEVIRNAKRLMHSRGIANGHSEQTYRRFLLDWRSRQFGKWVFSREGKSAWNDQCALYIERDPEKIGVGDILVADGHRLNFEIVNPYTGQPKRMTLIGWYDMRSNFLLGWDITPNEDTASIASALRRAILRLGKIPRIAYMDNGKAFASRFFNNQDLSQLGFSGLFARLGIETVFAWPYHGQSKTIERFFGTLAELERLAPSYTGTSIATKPAWMQRGEKVHIRQHDALTGGEVPTLAQAHRALGAWLDEYHTRKQAGKYCADTTPMELFKAGRGPGVDRLGLAYLMLADGTRTIGRNGISFNGSHYWHEALSERRHAVTIRYDLQDQSAIYVFDEHGEYICEAKPIDLLHPAAYHLGSVADQAQLDEYIRMKKSQERRDSSWSRRFAEDTVIPEARRQLKLAGFDPEAGAAADGSARSGVKRLPPPLSRDEQQTKDALDAGIAEARAAEKEEECLQAKRAEEAMTQMREKMGIGLRRQDVDPATEIQDETILDDGPEMWRVLPSLPEEQRYEKLAVLEARDILIPQQWRAFMRYFEATEVFERNSDRYDEIRFKARTAAMDNRAASK